MWVVAAGDLEAERQVARPGCRGSPPPLPLPRPACCGEEVVSQESKPARSPACKREKDRLSHGQCTLFVRISVQYSFFVIVIKCQFEYIYFFLWSIYYGNLLVTNSPVSGVTSISLEERLGSFFPYQL